MAIAKRTNFSTPHPGPLLVRRGEGELFCELKTQRSRWRGNAGLDDSNPIGIFQLLPAVAHGYGVGGLGVGVLVFALPPPESTMMRALL
jgi:hypothetical protein